MKHRPYKWVWEDPGTEFGEHSLAEKRVSIHPRLRNKKNHDILWLTLGHELIHQIFKDDDDKNYHVSEPRAYRLEQRAGEVLHDFYHRFKKSGLPKCDGTRCRVKE